MKLQFSVLTRRHDRAGFDCGDREMNEYVHRYLAQQVISGNTTCFVLENADNHEMLGFFTINPGSIPREEIPEDVHSAYPDASIYLIGRLAVSKIHQNKGYASLLIDEAIAVASADNVPKALGLLVELKNDDLINFYQRNSFRLITPNPHSNRIRMFLALRPNKKSFPATPPQINFQTAGQAASSKPPQSPPP